MKKTKKLLLGVLIALTVLALGGIAYAQKMAVTQKGGIGKREIFIERATPRSFSLRVIPKREVVPFKYKALSEIWQQLNFSQEQITALRKLKLNFQKNILELKKELEIKLLEYKDLLWSKTPDETKLNSLIEEIGKIRKDLQIKALEYQVEIKKLFTPEQLNKIRSLLFFGDKRIKEGFGHYFNLR